MLCTVTPESFAAYEALPSIRYRNPELAKQGLPHASLTALILLPADATHPPGRLYPTLAAYQATTVTA